MKILSLILLVTLPFFLLANPFASQQNPNGFSLSDYRDSVRKFGAKSQACYSIIEDNFRKRISYDVNLGAFNLYYKGVGKKYDFASEANSKNQTLSNIARNILSCI